MSNGAARPPKPPGNSFLAALRDYPFPMVVTAVVFAIVGGALSFVTKSGGGDEPPIRVKNGSLDLQLLSATNGWEPVGSSGKWKIKDGQRSKDPLQIELVSTNCGTQKVSGSTLTLSYSDGATVEIRSFSKHTVVTPTSATLSSLPSSPQLLTYQAEGYISSVALNGTRLCAFQGKEQLVSLGIFDY